MAIANGRAYYRHIPIADTDGGSFQALDETHPKDARHVWYCDTYRKSEEYWLVKRSRTTVIEGADPPTYGLLGQRYSRDAARIYFEGVPYPVKHPSTFAVLYSSYARDSVTGYYMREPVKGSDGATFEGLSDHVWYPASTSAPARA